jgi:hypothetical protein
MKKSVRLIEEFMEAKPPVVPKNKYYYHPDMV